MQNGTRKSKCGARKTVGRVCSRSGKPFISTRFVHFFLCLPDATPMSWITLVLALAVVAFAAVAAAVVVLRGFSCRARGRGGAKQSSTQQQQQQESHQKPLKASAASPIRLGNYGFPFFSPPTSSLLAAGSKLLISFCTFWTFFSVAKESRAAIARAPDQPFVHASLGA